MSTSLTQPTTYNAYTLPAMHAPEPFAPSPLPVPLAQCQIRGHASYVACLSGLVGPRAAKQRAPREKQRDAPLERPKEGRDDEDGVSKQTTKKMHKLHKDLTKVCPNTSLGGLHSVGCASLAALPAGEVLWV